ncbi:MAG: hypothetical protein Q9161_007918 [Pseudevernia consocians]
METRVRNFVLDKAVGLLQSFKTKLPPKFTSDIESGLSNATQIPPTDDTLQHCPSHGRRKSTSGDLEGDYAEDTNTPSDGPNEEVFNQQQQSTTSPSKGPIEQRVNLQPQFTEGPARVVMTNDGSKDCMALLMTDTLVAKLRELYEDSHHLSGKQGPLDYARREARDFEASINQIKELIEETQDEEKIEELQEMMQQREPQMLKISKRRDELEKGAKQLERNVASSRAHIQWVLDTAMKEADLLEPHRPLTPVTINDFESEFEDQEEIHQNTYNGKASKDANHKAIESVTHGAEFPKQHSGVLANTDDDPEESQLLHRVAWESYNETLATMHKVKALFDNRQQSYETDLADYQQGFRDGIYKISRSEFDRSKIRYGQKVTRALIDAEEDFEAAKEQAQAVGAIGSDYDDAANSYGCYEESWPESQLVSYIATKDWGSVHDWLAGLPEPSNPEEIEQESESPEVDDWYADEVDPADSISQIDFDDYRKDIDRWENIRFERWDDMHTQVGGPEVQVGFLVRSIETLKRRHSVSLSHSGVGEWDTNTYAV